MALMRTRRGDEPNNNGKVSSKTGGKVKLKNVSLKDNGDKYTAEKANEDYAKAIKSGSMVSVNDPSVDPTTRKFVMGAISGSDVLGKRTDVAIPKGYKASSYKDIYGVDYNPDEFREASKGKDFDKYLSKKGISAGQSFVPNFGYQAKYETAADIKKQKDIDYGSLRTELGEPAKVKISTMEFKKPVGISTKTRGQLSISERPDDEKWTAPSKGLVSVEEKFYTRGGKEKTNKAISKVVENVKRRVQYGQELKQGKAYFGRFEGMSAGDISETKKALRQEVKDIRTGASINKLEDFKTKRSMIKDVKSELKQSKQAGKYIKNLGAQYTASGARAGESSKRMTSSGDVVDEGTGRIRFATPESFKNYRKSDDNATNRNRTFGRKK